MLRVNGAGGFKVGSKFSTFSSVTFNTVTGLKVTLDQVMWIRGNKSKTGSEDEIIKLHPKNSRRHREPGSFVGATHQEGSVGKQKKCCKISEEAKPLTGLELFLFSSQNGNYSSFLI